MVYFIQIFNIYLAKIYYQIFNYVINNIKIILQINISEIFINKKKISLKISSKNTALNQKINQLILNLKIIHLFQNILM